MRRRQGPRVQRASRVIVGVTNLKAGDVVSRCPSCSAPTASLPSGYEYPRATRNACSHRALCPPVPEWTRPRHAALTEPMAVGLHAVANSGIAPADGAQAWLRPVGLRVDRRAGSQLASQPIVAPTSHGPAARW
jgi:hypothetical protein